MPPGWRPLHDYACLFTVFQSSHACTSGAWEPPLQAFLCSSPPNVLLPQTCVLSSTSCSLHSSRTSRFFSMQVVVLPLPLLGALHDLRFSTCLHPVSLLLLRLFPPCALTRSSLPTPLPHLSLPAPSLTFKPGRALSGQPYCATLHTSPERALTLFHCPHASASVVRTLHPVPRARDRTRDVAAHAPAGPSWLSASQVVSLPTQPPCSTAVLSRSSLTGTLPWTVNTHTHTHMRKAWCCGTCCARDWPAEATSQAQAWSCKACWSASLRCGTAESVAAKQAVAKQQMGCGKGRGERCAASQCALSPLGGGRMRCSPQRTT